MSADTTTTKSDLEIKIVIPVWLFAVLWLTTVTGVLMTSGTNILLLRQRAVNDAEFMAKVREIQDENAQLREQIAQQNKDRP